MKTTHIDRRTMLKGLGSITIGLPLLEEMLVSTTLAAKQKALELEGEAQRERERSLARERQQVSRTKRVLTGVGVVLLVLAGAVVTGARQTNLNRSRLFVQQAAEAERSGHLDRAMRLAKRPQDFWEVCVLLLH